MARLQKVDYEQSTGATRELLDQVKAKVGMLPNLILHYANSPAALQSYLTHAAALQQGSIKPPVAEQIALAVSEANGCHYCVNAHTMIGKMIGLTEEQTLAARRGDPDDPQAAAAVKFALAVLHKKGFVDDAEVQAVKEVGFDDGAIAEIVSHVALNLMNNYMNHVAASDVDFPEAPALSGAATSN